MKEEETFHMSNKLHNYMVIVAKWIWVLWWIKHFLLRYI